MKIILNNDEMKEAVKLYIREKCIYHGWEILGVEIKSENGDIIGITSLNTVDPLTRAPSPVPCAPSAPATPPRQY
jgi:hypothetical protein